VFSLNTSLYNFNFHHLRPPLNLHFYFVLLCITATLSLDKYPTLVYIVTKHDVFQVLCMFQSCRRHQILIAIFATLVDELTSGHHVSHLTCSFHPNYSFLSTNAAPSVESGPKAGLTLSRQQDSVKSNITLSLINQLHHKYQVYHE
jgi:hypothetical protein